MKKAYRAVHLAALTTLFGALTSAWASPPPANAYTSLAQLPDWSGVWEPMAMAHPEKEPLAAPPKLTPAYTKQYAAYQKKNRKTPGLNFVSKVANCVPPGLPGSMLQPYPIEFLFTPGRVTVLIETYSIVRRVYTDGSPPPAEPDPSYQGTSVGHWDGATLVVDTTGILPETAPITGILGHGENMRVSERIQLSSPDVLAITTTLTDPTVFAQPYTFTTHYQRHRDWKIMEYVCAQNNHDSVDDQGHAQFSLEPK